VTRKGNIFFIGLFLSNLAFADPSSKSIKLKESDFVKFHCDGDIEHVLSDRTRVDCLNDRYAIEFDFDYKWAEAIGQSLYYASVTGKKAGIVLILRNQQDNRYLKRLNQTVDSNKLPIKIWFVPNSISYPRLSID